ncbi:Signal recognition particle receptor FtsY [Candidatus Bilamarchaeum dharawalense]|uniref:Signal recognition particle receptor FtsY n=1 Tax=Candidatus Bilamarchaeum dharawalense TaxID=2885759 RepID=A0A5E4LN38_9ARCH|nr:Signal recognition particle receptor FtsY [Candidatus Bilamarchaeum dharawalense]
MFDFLKKKIGGFIEGLTKKKSEETEDNKSEIVEQKVEKKEKVEIKKPDEKISKPQQEKTTKKLEPIPEKIEAKKTAPISEKKEIKKQADIPKPKIEEKKPQMERVVVTSLVKEKIEVESTIQKTEIKKIEAPEKPTAPKIEKKPEPVVEKKEEKQRIKLGIVSTVKSIITREVEIKENDVKQMLDDFELELLEADVDIGVAEGIKQELNEKIIGAKIPKDKLQSFISDKIKETLVDVLTNEKSFDILEKVEQLDKPVKIMLIGINGAGKTTTIAKIAKLLMDNKKKVIFAAADTFRAAAIEQMEVHADRLGIKIIKRDYGSDPTSVAFDAVNHAKAHAIDAVLIDTAGRQDTNISLINEVKKMSRVIQPDLKIYIGESIAGNAIIEQIATFNKEIGIDAVILTKLDCDPKGGTMLSINRATGIPIIYVGVGQKYDDLERFEPAKIVENIVG